MARWVMGDGCGECGVDGSSPPMPRGRRQLEPPAMAAEESAQAHGSYDANAWMQRMLQPQCAL